MTRTGWFGVGIMRLNGISVHGAGSLETRLGSPIKAPGVFAVISQYPSGTDLRCCKNVKPQQPTDEQSHTFYIGDMSFSPSCNVGSAFLRGPLLLLLLGGDGWANCKLPRTPHPT